jgi:hypothetical protein
MAIQSLAPFAGNCGMMPNNIVHCIHVSE